MENLPIATIRPTSQLHKLVWAGWFLFTSMGSTGCTGVNVPPKEPPLPTVPPLINQTLPPTQPPTVTTPSVIEREPSDHLPPPQRETNHPVATSCKNIQEAGISKVAAQLAEMGYFQASIAQPEMTEVTEALKRFQRDLKVSQTGCLDSFTLQKLNSVKLTGVRKAELEAVRHPTPAGTSPKSVLWIEKIECKSEHEVWVLYYEGTLSTQSSNVTLNKRYALWYDSRQQGESTKDWWCIPRREFCYTSVKFSDWAGQYQSGQEIEADEAKIVENLARLKLLIRDKECSG